MISSFLFFSHRNSIYGGGVGVGDATGGPRGREACPRGGAPHPRGKGVGPLVFIFGKDFLFFSKMFLGVSGRSENICFLHIKQHHGNSAENNVSPG